MQRVSWMGFHDLYSEIGVKMIETRLFHHQKQLLTPFETSLNAYEIEQHFYIPNLSQHAYHYFPDCKNTDIETKSIFLSLYCRSFD